MGLVWCQFCDSKHDDASWCLRLQRRIKEDRIDDEEEEYVQNSKEELQDKVNDVVEEIRAGIVWGQFRMGQGVLAQCVV
jgi:hypothetical protein